MFFKYECHPFFTVFVTVYCDIDKDSRVIQGEEWVLLIHFCI